MLSFRCSAYEHNDCGGWVAAALRGDAETKCLCECHDATPDCSVCHGTGSYPDDLPEFIVCTCVIKNRAAKSGAT
jgi:hypothetical protein